MGTSNQGSGEIVHPLRHIVHLNVCTPCWLSLGNECHTPGCSFWMSDTPSPEVIGVLRRHEAANYEAHFVSGCKTCRGTGLVPNGLPSNGPDPCPDCAPANGGQA